MSVVKLDANFAIASIVESMLPRFSDSKLGLLIGIDMSITDYGYDNGNNIIVNILRDEMSTKD